MPPARSATSRSTTSRSAASRSAASAARERQRTQAPPPAPPHGLVNRLPISGIRWDRKLRTIMLLVLMLVGWIGIRGISTLISTRAQADQEHAIVATLARENHRLEQQQRSLNNPATIASIARSLGMVQAGERSYVVTGLSNR
jgi:cell division protein FtsB